MALAPAPLFRDPVEDGAADPTVIWNPHEGAWWMVYTNRRTTAPFEDGIGWLFGAALGVASSVDGVRWDYRGTLAGLEVEWGHNTFWAPEIVADDDGTFHMFVSYIRGIPAHGSAPEMLIRHYTSPDLLTWTHLGVLPLGSSRAPTTSARGCTATSSATASGRGSSTSPTPTAPSVRTRRPSAGARRSRWRS